MKYQQLIKIIGLTSVISLTGCSVLQSNMPTETVSVSQIGDSKLDCQQLQSGMNTLENDITDMMVIKAKRANQTFAVSSVVDITLALLSGKASANNRIDRTHLKDFSQPERERINSLAERHNHLFVIAKEKKCDFVPKMENRIFSKTFDRPSATPALDQQSYRKRITNH